MRYLLGDKGYDAEQLRRLAARCRSHSGHPWPPQPQAHHPLRQEPLPRPPPHRECLLTRLKDFRRVATSYDKLATNFLSGVALVTAIAFWL